MGTSNLSKMPMHGLPHHNKWCGFKLFNCFSSTLHVDNNILAKACLLIKTPHFV